MKAAVCYELGKPLVVEDVLLDPPKAGEVRVRIGAVAICHSDVHLVTARYPLERINEAIVAMEGGEALRNVVVFPEIATT